VIAENKDTPHFTPQQLIIEVDEEKPGIVDTNEIITVVDRDGVSKKSLMCSTLMMKLHQSELKPQFVPRSKHSVSVIKTNQLILHRDTLAVCSQIHTKHINEVWAEYRNF
jgi:hypothetical protein